MEKHNSCINTLAIIDYLKRRGGDPQQLLAGLEEKLAGLGDPISFLSDLNNWVSTDICLGMYANARRITGDTGVAFQIGFESVTHNKLGYIQQILLRALGTPHKVLQRLRQINDKFNRNKEIEIISRSRNQALIRLHWRKDLNLSQDFCLVNRGIYSAIPTTWGLPPANLEETKCQFKGAEYCEFRVAWQNPSMVNRLRLFFSNRLKLLDDTLSEIEQDKLLLEEKYSEVQSLNVKLAQRIDQLLTIQEASGAILSASDYTDLFPNVLQSFVRQIGYSRAMIMLVDREAGALKFKAAVGEEPAALTALEGYEIPLSRRNNILVRVVRNGKPVLGPGSREVGLNPDNLIIKNFQPGSFVLLPLNARGKVIGILAADRGKASAGLKAEPDEEFLNGFANQVALAIENARMYQELREGFLSTIQALASAIEAKDPYTRGHSERVTNFSVHLAEQVNLPQDRIERLRNMCLLHDIGKIGIDRALLNKKERLENVEFDIIKQHPLIGVMILQPLRLTQEELSIVRNHHERFDGNGYPDRLKRQEIPLEVRIVTLCDAFDAMASDRPYRSALPLEVVMEELKREAGRQFDSKLVSLLIESIRRGRIEAAHQPTGLPLNGDRPQA